MRTAILKRGVAVVVLPGDVALAPAPDGAAGPWAEVALPPHRSDRSASSTGWRRCSTAPQAVTLLCGSGCAGAHDDVVAFADALAAPVVHALRGKEYVEWDNPFDVGMTGLIGFSSGYHAMLSCDTLVMLGTDFPYRNFYPTKAKIVQVDHPTGGARAARARRVSV